jgi:hypothetical protein
MKQVQVKVRIATRGAKHDPHLTVPRKKVYYNIKVFSIDKQKSTSSKIIELRIDIL